jgi:hypothetical protein
MQVKQASFARTPQTADLAPLAGIQPQLVLVFGSVAALTAPGLTERLVEAFGEVSLAGCTTAGEITAKGVTDGQLVVTALHFDEPGFQVATTVLAGMGDSAAAGLRLARQLDHPDLHDVVVLSQGVGVNGSALIEGFGEGLPPHVRLSGGLAGDGGAFKQSFTLSRQTVSSDQIVALGFHAPRLELRHGTFHGWNHFGPARKVTRSAGNVLFELDGSPALEVYKRYLGDFAKDLPGSGLLFPFEMLGSERQELGLIRTILGVDEGNGSLVLAGDIDPSGYLRLMHASTDSLVDGAREAALSVGHSGDGLALLVSCVGRKLVMGARVDDEVDAVTEVFGPATQVAGFYSNGEISPSQRGGSACHLHNQTMTITHLTERQAA